MITPLQTFLRKLKALLNIAGQSANKVVKRKLKEDACKSTGAWSNSIADVTRYSAYLLLAAFCMFNRYVDGLDAQTPTDLSSYPLRAKQVAENGYGSHIYLQKHTCINI
jgi:uncharacterized protein YqjF (DUF2071 family)